MEENNFQYVDLSVSRIKYDKELNDYLLIESDWRRKGVFLVNRQFPCLDFVFTAPKLTPSSIVFAVGIDFTNYDAEPLSIKFINPFTGELVLRKEVPIRFNQVSLPDQVQNHIPVQFQIKQQDLLQGGPEDIPFFCIRGVREYHSNPAHTGDSWFLYRKSGIGTLNFLLDQLYNYSLPQIVSYSVQLQPIISFQQQVSLTQ